MLISGTQVVEWLWVNANCAADPGSNPTKRSFAACHSPLSLDFLSMYFLINMSVPEKIFFKKRLISLDLSSQKILFEENSLAIFPSYMWFLSSSSNINAHGLIKVHSLNVASLFVAYNLIIFFFYFFPFCLFPSLLCVFSSLCSFALFAFLTFILFCR